MNQRLVWLLVIIVIGYFVWKSYDNNVEGFLYYPRRRHVKLNDMDGIEYVSTRPPKCRGEYSCGVVPCPAVYQGDAICWKCKDKIVDLHDVWSNAYF